MSTSRDARGADSDRQDIETARDRKVRATEIKTLYYLRCMRCLVSAAWASASLQVMAELACRAIPHEP